MGYLCLKYTHSVLWKRSGGRGRIAITAPAQTILPSNEADGSGGRDCKILFPVFDKRNSTAKIQTVKGLRVEIFSPLFAKKYYPPLDRLNRRNGCLYSSTPCVFCCSRSRCSCRKAQFPERWLSRLEMIENNNSCSFILLCEQG